MFFKFRFIVIGLLIFGGQSAPGAASDPEFSDAPVTSIRAFTDSQHSPSGALDIGSEYARKNRNLDEAIEISRRALALEPDDLDLHVRYAEALEKKLASQDKRDPALYNECVKQWLSVLRSESGDEKGMTYHGVGLPGMVGFFGDAERHIPAKQHLVSLTGYAPKAWETNSRYLKRVLVPATSAVKAEMVDK